MLDIEIKYLLVWHVIEHNIYIVTSSESQLYLHFPWVTELIWFQISPKFLPCEQKRKVTALSFWYQKDILFYDLSGSWLKHCRMNRRIPTCNNQLWICLITESQSLYGLLYLYFSFICPHFKTDTVCVQWCA